MEELRPYTTSKQTQFKQAILAAWNIDHSHRLEADPLLDETAYKTLARIEAYRLRAECLFHRNLTEITTPDNHRYIPQVKPNIPTSRPSATAS